MHSVVALQNTISKLLKDTLKHMNFKHFHSLDNLYIRFSHYMILGNQYIGL